MDVAFDEDPSHRWLFLFAHPDDELAICGWMNRLVGLGATVGVCWLHATPVREAESRQVAEMIGLEPEQLRFLDAPDGGFVRCLARLEAQLKSVLGDFKPTRLVVPAFEQGHLDHDATNLLASRVFGGPRFEVPMYHTYATRFPWMGRFSDPTGEEVLRLSPEESRLKKRCARCFPSQPIWRNILCSEARDVVLGRRATMAQVERLRLQKHSDFRTPNHPAPLSARVARSGAWRAWLEALGASMGDEVR